MSTVVYFWPVFEVSACFFRRQHHFENNQRNCNTTGLLSDSNWYDSVHSVHSPVNYKLKTNHFCQIMLSIDRPFLSKADSVYNYDCSRTVSFDVFSFSVISASTAARAAVSSFKLRRTYLPVENQVIDCICLCFIIVNKPCF